MLTRFHFKNELELISYGQVESSNISVKKKEEELQFNITHVVYF